MGDWLGAELSVIDNYKTIDVVIPVPLHKKKLKKRGYNQVTLFGKTLAESLNATFLDDVLIKVTNTKSQTKKTRLARWSASQEIFSAQHLETINGKHVLLVDDLITTGATLEACANQLLQAENVKISIATMAITG